MTRYVKHHLMSKAADEWAKKMGTGWEKAPVEMLAQVRSGGSLAPKSTRATVGASVDAFGAGL